MAPLKTQSWRQGKQNAYLNTSCNSQAGKPLAMFLLVLGWEPWLLTQPCKWTHSPKPGAYLTIGFESRQAGASGVPRAGGYLFEAIRPHPGFRLKKSTHNYIHIYTDGNIYIYIYSQNMGVALDGCKGNRTTNHLIWRSKRKKTPMWSRVRTFPCFIRRFGQSKIM